MSAIEIRTAQGTWVVRAGGAVIGESTRALELIEGGREAVIHFPRDDIAMAFLDASQTTTVCPTKGRATYYHLVTQSTTHRDAAWCYEEPVESAGAIAGHIAFYPEHVVIERV